MNDLEFDPTRSVDPIDDPRVAAAVAEYQAQIERGVAPDRRAFLARFPDIAELLSGCLRAIDFVHHAVHGAAEIPSAVSSASDLGPESLVGDFRIIREMGRGGMGVVYEAEQRSLGRLVALKVLPSAAALDDRSLQRFRHEALAAATLHHPNIVSVHAVGNVGDIHYIAMQLIEGRTLAELIATLRTSVPPAAADTSNATAGEAPTDDPSRVSETSLPSDTALTRLTVRTRSHYREAARLMVQAARALEHAHEFGVVHRDIKPGNLLLDRGGNLWVADFGLAKLPESDLTAPNATMGTLRYMSPEQAAGRAGSVDGRSDVYSLGATLYELLTLVPLFSADDRQSLLQKVLLSEPVSPQKIDRGIPFDLETITLSALAKEPGERYQSVTAMAEDLQRFLDDRPIEARPPTRIQRTRKWLKRNRVLVGITGSVSVAAMLASLAVLVASNSAIDRKRVEAEAARDRESKALAAEKEARSETDRALTAETAAKGKFADLLQAEQAARIAERRMSYLHAVALSFRERNAGRLKRARELLANCPEEYRRWEWHYLNQLCSPELAVIDSGSEVLDLSLTATGDRLYAVGPKGLLGWHFPSWKPLHFTANPLSNRSTALLIPRDGKSVITFTPPKYLRGGEVPTDTNVLALVFTKVWAWSADTGAAQEGFDPPATKPAERGSVNAAAVSPDGKWLVTGGFDKLIRVWDLSTHTISRVAARPDRIEALDIAPDGRVASLARNGAIHIWDVAANQTQEIVAKAVARKPAMMPAGPSGGVIPVVGLSLRGENHRTDYRGLAISPDGKYLAVGTVHGELRLFLLSNGEPAHTIHTGPNSVRWFTFSADARAVFTIAEFDTSINMWDVNSGRLLTGFHGHEHDVMRAALSRDGRTLTSGSLDGKLRSWDTTTRTEARWVGQLTLEGVPMSFRSHSLQFSPDSSSLVVSGGQTVQGWDVGTGRRLNQYFTTAGTTLAGAAFLRDGKFICQVGNANAAVRGTLRKEDEILYPLGSELQTVVPPVATTQRRDHTQEEYRPNRVSFSADGSVFVCRAAPGGAKLKDSATGNTLRRYESPTATAVYSVAITADGQRVATCRALPSKTYAITIWEARSGEPLRTIPSRLSVPNLSFSPDGGILAAAGSDGIVVLFDSRTGEEVRRFKAGDQERTALAFSPDGERFAMGVGRYGESEGAVALCDVRTGQELLRLPLGSQPTALAFSPDGRSLAAAEFDGTIWVFDGRPVSPSERTIAQKNRAEFWHEEHQRQSWLEDNKWASQWHLRHLAMLRPLDASLAAKVRSLPKLSQPLPAPPIVELSTTEIQRAYRMMAEHLATGDLAGYRALCTTMLALLAPETKPYTKSLIYRLCLYGPEGVEQPMELVRHIEASIHRGNDAYGYYLLRGMALYRAGHYGAALLDLTESEFHEPSAPSHPIGWLFLAMSHHQMGQKNQAKLWLARAGLWQINNIPPKPGAKAVTFQVLVPFPVLQKEAVVLLARIMQ